MSKKHRTPDRRHRRCFACCLALAGMRCAGLTPQQVADEVRAMERLAGGRHRSTPALASVPAPPVEPCRLCRHREPLDQMPTLEDKSRLEAQLACRQQRIEDSRGVGSEHSARERGDRGSWSDAFHVFAGRHLRGRSSDLPRNGPRASARRDASGRDLPTAGDTARWTIAATRGGTAQ